MASEVAGCGLAGEPKRTLVVGEPSLPRGDPTGSAVMQTSARMNAPARPVALPGVVEALAQLIAHLLLRFAVCHYLLAMWLEYWDGLSHRVKELLAPVAEGGDFEEKRAAALALYDETHPNLASCLSGLAFQRVSAALLSTPSEHPAVLELRKKRQAKELEAKKDLVMALFASAEADAPNIRDAGVRLDDAAALTDAAMELTKGRTPELEEGGDDSVSESEVSAVLAALLEEEDSEFVAISMWGNARCKAQSALPSSPPPESCDSRLTI